MAVTILNDGAFNSSTRLDSDYEGLLKVKDDFGRKCCPDELVKKGIKLWYQNSNFKINPKVWGHAALETPHMFMGFYPRGSAIRLEHTFSDGRVVDETKQPPRAWTDSFDYDACPSSIRKLDHWIKHQSVIFDENLNKSQRGFGTRYWSNPFGGEGGKAYSFDNSEGGRNCLGWAAQGIESIGGKPPIPSKQVMTIEDGGINLRKPL
jgi:hypothetical protein